jgi:SAM-dependent methyltransferase
MSRYSYSSTTVGLGNRLNELRQLMRATQRSPESGADWVMKLYKATSSRITEATGLPVENMKGLDIGPGQQLGCLKAFSVHNDVVGIDTDIIAQGFNPLDYLRMLQHNSAMRTVKTFARKALGVDARFNSALAERFGVKRFPRLRVLKMSATQMTFPDETFDFVYTHSVFEHIDDPEAAMREVRRVLKPGGVAYISIHIFTSHSGCHDPKILTDGTPIPPLWPHLRPSLVDTVRPNTYLNKVLLKGWREMFDRVMPGTNYVNDRQDDEIGDGLRLLREQGELADYSDEELMTVNFIGIWRKPPLGQSIGS